MAMKYPEVAHKLPPLFVEIIKLDKAIEEFKRSKVLDFNLGKEFLRERREFSRAAANHVKSKFNGSDNTL